MNARRPYKNGAAARFRPVRDLRAVAATCDEIFLEFFAAPRPAKFAQLTYSDDLAPKTRVRRAKKFRAARVTLPFACEFGACDADIVLDERGFRSRGDCSAA